MVRIYTDKSGKLLGVFCNTESVRLRVLEFPIVDMTGLEAEVWGMNDRVAEFEKRPTTFLRDMKEFSERLKPTLDLKGFGDFLKKEGGK
jgi:hypothetical protein